MIVAIWFVGGTTKLHVRVATTTNVNDGIDSSIAALPLNCTTSVRVEAFGRDVILFLNNSVDTMVTVSADRIFGEAMVYASDPWHTPAPASFGFIKMESLSGLSFNSSSDFNGRLTRLAVYEIATIVPANFALSFDIKPHGTVPDLASIIHYTKDKTNMGAGGRIPGTFLKQV